MDIKSIFDRINIKNGTILFDPEKSQALEDFLPTLGKLEYIGHGAQSVCFVINKEVVKCCKKKKGSLILSKEYFLSGVQELLDNNMPILPPIDVIYENEFWMIYTQPLCKVLSGEDISPGLCCEILNFVSQMIRMNIRVSDIFFRNFGIYQNKLCLFDFHDVDKFESSSNFMIANLYSVFTQLGKNIGWPVLDLTIANLTTVINDKFGESRFPEMIVKFLQSLYSKNYSKSLEYLENSKLLLKQHVQKKYTKYQQVSVSETGSIELESHTLGKYNLALEIIKSKNIKTLLDARCCIGGIGLKLAKEYPNIKVMLSNNDLQELEKTKNIGLNCMIFNVQFIPEHIKDIKPCPNNKYDLVLYYSLFHHLLKTQTIEDILKLVKSQTGKYCIIEVPIIGDSLLNKVMKSGNQENFGCLKSHDVFRQYLVLNNIMVNKCVRLDYGSEKLIRYAYSCNV